MRDRKRFTLLQDTGTLKMGPVNECCILAKAHYDRRLSGKLALETQTSR